MDKLLESWVEATMGHGGDAAVMATMEKMQSSK